MSYKYKKKKYYNRKKYEKYNAYEDIVKIALFAIIVLGIGIAKLYKESPLIFWAGITLIVISIGIVFYIYRKLRAKKYMKIQTLEQMKNMDWREFEKFIAFVFQKKGFKAKERKGTNDGGIDVDATKNGQKYVIQCKKWKDYKVGVVEIRSFIGAMEVEGSNLKGIYVTTSKLTQEAQIYFNKMSHKLELWDSSNLESYIHMYTGRTEGIIQPQIPHKEIHPLCEKCGGEMLIREAHRGSHKGEKFYGCSNYPKCKHIIQTKTTETL